MMRKTISMGIVAAILFVALIVFTANSPKVLAQQENYGEFYGTENYLITLYHFNNETGDRTCVDSAIGWDEEYQNGTYNNTLFAQGKFGNGLNFDGQSRWVWIPNQGGINLTYHGINNYFSISIWLYSSSYASTTEYILFKNNQYKIYLSGNYIYWYIEYYSGNTKYTRTLSTRFVYNSWHMWTFSYDNNYFRLYLDSNQRTATYVGHKIIKPSNDPLFIGCANDHTGNYKGKIDELSFFVGQAYYYSHYITNLKIISNQNPTYTNQTSSYTIYAYNWFNNPSGSVGIDIYYYNQSMEEYQLIYTSRITYIGNSNPYYTFTYYYTKEGNYKIYIYLYGNGACNDTLLFHVYKGGTSMPEGIVLAPEIVESNISFPIYFYMRNTPFSNGYVVMTIYDPLGNLFIEMNHTLYYQNYNTIMANFTVVLPYYLNKTLNLYEADFKVYDSSNSLIGIWHKTFIVQRSIVDIESQKIPLHPYFLAKGWNLISIPSHDPISASDIFKMNDNITAIALYIDGNYIYMSREFMDSMDISIDGSTAVFIYVKNATTLKFNLMSIKQFTESTKIDDGWNLVGVPYNYIIRPETLCQKNPHIKAITIRKGGHYYTYINGFTDPDMFPYSIETGDGVFIYSDESTEVIW